MTLHAKYIGLPDQEFLEIRTLCDEVLVKLKKEIDEVTQEILHENER